MSPFLERIAGSAGQVIFLYSFLGGLAIVALWLATYSAHLLLSVVEQTAAGADEIAFPDEPFTDWVWKGAYFWGLAVLGPVLLWLVLRNRAEPPQPLTRAVLSALIVWLVFPLFLLSSLSATSLLVLVRWRILQRLAHRWDAFTAFLLLSAVCPFGIMLANGALLFGRGAAEERQTQALVVGVPLVSILSMVLLFFYARLIGRLGWVLRPHRVPKKRKKRDRLPITKPGPSEPANDAPLDMELAPEPDEDATAFGLRDEEAIAPVPLPRTATKPEDEEDEEDEEELVANLPVKSWTELLRPAVFCFPLYENCRAPLVWLSLGWMILLCLAMAVSGIYASRLAVPREAPAEDAQLISNLGP